MSWKITGNDGVMVSENINGLFRPKVGFVSLGCPKATVDSEKILTALKSDGYELVNQYDVADLVIVNTCGFIDEAVQESLDAIGEALHANGKVIVTGCLGAKQGKSGQMLVREVHPKVLAVTGPNQLCTVMDAVRTHLPIEPQAFVDSDTHVQLTPRHYAYLKISEGCNQKCTFCIIPLMRGELVSRPIDQVLDEAKQLFDQGVKELLVVSQDTGAYGADLKFKMAFWGGRPIKTHILDLAAALGTLASQYGAWVRLHYLYPYPHLDQLLPLMSQGLILPYFDMPFQHADIAVLQQMKRPAQIEKQLERIQNWRALCPDLTIRSTFIVGFPGETVQAFEILLQFIRQAQLDRVGCFTYSAVDGAQANILPNQVPEEIKLMRQAELMKLASEVSAARLQLKVGKRSKVIVDQVNKQGGVGRTMGDAPEIDGLVFLLPTTKASKRYRVGDIVSVQIVGSKAHDLIAEVV